MKTDALLWLTRKSWRYYQTAHFDVDVQINGRALKVPIRRGLGHGLLRPSGHIQRVIRALYDDEGRRGCLVDVGANLGIVLLSMHACGLDLSYLGFEPSVYGATYIEELIAANSFRNAHIVPIALGEKCGLTDFYTEATNRSCASATTSLELRPGSMYSARVRVPMGWADDYLANLDRIFFVKIDVEGTEEAVLKGMEQTIRRHRPAIYFEVMGTEHLTSGSYDRSYFGELKRAEIERLINNRTENAVRLQEFFTARGYLLSEATAEKIAPVDRIRLHSPEINYLALPAERRPLN